MKSFTKHTGVVAPLMKSNIDTDAIMPKQFLKSIKKTGYGDNLFDEWRYLDHGEPGMDCANRPLNPDFELNNPEYQGASILITGPNFGCGSSREHAPWGLAEYGFKVIIAPSFADIFYNNCTKNGILPICLEQEVVDELVNLVQQNKGVSFSVDLPAQKITVQNKDYSFNIESQVKSRLLEGLDDIALTLKFSSNIKDFEKTYFSKYPWLENRLTK